MQRLFLTAVLVRDYDEAIAFYVNRLGFEVRLDTPLSPTKRWDLIQHSGAFGLMPVVEGEMGRGEF
jgi:catechol 2,3-dioxygenase-like lactoylglutathione lyase family enzyme